MTNSDNIAICRLCKQEIVLDDFSVVSADHQRVICLRCVLRACDEQQRLSIVIVRQLEEILNDI